MSIFQGDIAIKTAIELCIEDMRNNMWLIDHMLGDLAGNPYFANKYGQKQIDSCKEWFKNNTVNIYMSGRSDRDKLPSITIQMGSSQEKIDMKSMADQSVEKVALLPNQTGKPIPYVIKPFVPTGYNDVTGEVSIDPSVDLSAVATNMILVNPTNGQGYLILGITANGLLIDPGREISATQFGIVPQFQYYEARVEHSFFDESYQIGCHAHGDAQNVLFLWSIVKYSLLRYRESLFEANGFTQTVISSGQLDHDDDYTTEGGEKAWVRFITISGMVENSWIKSPRRFVESMTLRGSVPVGPNAKASKGYTGGILILSNVNTPEFIDQSNESWVTDSIVNNPNDPEDQNGG
jgi:hypothetical protein